MKKTYVNGQERVVISGEELPLETVETGSAPADAVVEQPATTETAEPVGEAS